MPFISLKIEPNSIKNNHFKTHLTNYYYKFVLNNGFFRSFV